jgi:yecA family protein
MQNLFVSLSPAELNSLESHLALHRGSDGFDLVGLNGFLYGILSLRRPANPSDWIQTALTESAVGSDEKNAEWLFDLVIRYYNQIAETMLIDEPLTIYCDGTVQQSGDWLKAFARAMAFDPKGVEEMMFSNEEVEQRMGEVMFAQMIDPETVGDHKEMEVELQWVINAQRHQQSVFEKNTPAQNLEYLGAVASLVKQILRTKGKRFGSNKTSQWINTSGAPMKRETPKVGRNDFCPCGSGKKYKYCHGKSG